MNEPVDGSVVAPDVGSEVSLARTVGHDARVVVVAADVDGPPLGMLTWPGVWVVTEQEPPASCRVAKWDNVRATFRRADGNEAGDREPRLPSPSPDQLEARASLDDAPLQRPEFSAASLR